MMNNLCNIGFLVMDMTGINGKIIHWNFCAKIEIWKKKALFKNLYAQVTN